jgi:hypothetical protein
MNPEKQTVEYNLRIRQEFKQSVRARMGIWEAMEKLSELVDDSDPDVGLLSVIALQWLPLFSLLSMRMWSTALARGRRPMLRRISDAEYFACPAGCFHSPLPSRGVL